MSNDSFIRLVPQSCYPLYLVSQSCSERRKGSQLHQEVRLETWYLIFLYRLVLPMTENFWVSENELATFPQDPPMQALSLLLSVLCSFSSGPFLCLCSIIQYMLAALISIVSSPFLVLVVLYLFNGFYFFTGVPAVTRGDKYMCSCAILNPKTALYILMTKVLKI